MENPVERNHTGTLTLAGQGRALDAASGLRPQPHVQVRCGSKTSLGPQLHIRPEARRYWTVSNCTAIVLAVRFGNARNPYFIAFCAPVHFGGPLRRKIALKGVPELFTIVATGAAAIRPDVVRADPERL